VARGRDFVDSKVFGASPGPYRALELMAAAKTADRTEAYAAEDEALADLIMAPELRASLYAFDLVQKRARKPAGAPDATLARPLTKVGIVGAGLMATQLALLFLRRLQVPVVITDVDQERVDQGIGYVLAEIDKLLGKQRISPMRRTGCGIDLWHHRASRLRRLRLRDRGGLRGAVDQEAGLRGPRETCPGQLRACHEHVLTVRDADLSRS
jgi:hypothetical protein